MTRLHLPSVAALCAPLVLGAALGAPLVLGAALGAPLVLGAALCAPLVLVACSSSAPSQAPAASSAPQEASPTASLDGFRQPRANLWTGGRPSDSDLDAFAAMPGGLVISLLAASELGDEAARVAARQLEFLSIPIAGPDDLTEYNARKLGDTLRDHAGQPVLLHCGSGNRAGALLALSAYYVEGMKVEDAVALGLSAGLSSLESAVRERLSAACADQPERC